LLVAHVTHRFQSRKNLLEEGAIIAYSARGANWFVLSGTKGNKTFYSYAAVSPDRMIGLNAIVSPLIYLRRCKERPTVELFGESPGTCPFQINSLGQH